VKFYLAFHILLQHLCWTCSWPFAQYYTKRLPCIMSRCPNIHLITRQTGLLSKWEECNGRCMRHYFQGTLLWPVWKRVKMWPAATKYFREFVDFCNSCDSAMVHTHWCRYCNHFPTTNGVYWWPSTGALKNFVFDNSRKINCFDVMWHFKVVISGNVQTDGRV
jgi:hypothetical protein